MWMNIANGGIYVPFVRNAMPKNAFWFVRQYIHFADNRRRNDDPLYKIKKIVSKISDKLNLAWNANIIISVDESMIKYKGRSVKFIQYMPKKPINRIPVIRYLPLRVTPIFSNKTHALNTLKMGILLS
jgi:hypothetical protein